MMRSLRPKKLSKREEYERTLRVRNIISDLEKAYKNLDSFNSNEIKLDSKESSFKSINEIQDKDLRKLFIKCIENSHKKGSIYKIINESGIDKNIFYRTKKRLNIPNFDLSITRNNLESEIIESYLVDELSTEDIGLKYGFSPCNINKILKNNGIKLRSKHSNNPLKFSTRSGISKEELPNLIYKKFVLEKKSLKQISLELNIDSGTVSTKIKAMNYQDKIKKRSSTNKEFQCLWCSKIGLSWTTGKKQQKYCCSKCKNQAKDLRVLKGSSQRISNQLKHLQMVWGDKYNLILDKIMENAPGQNKIISISNSLNQTLRGESK